MTTSGTPQRRHRGDAGAAAVELALVLPILLLLVFGITEFARAFNAQVSLTHAAREGARIVALGGSSGDATTATLGALTTVPAGAVSVTATTCPDPPVGADATVQATHQFTYITPLGALMGIFGGSGLSEPTLTGRGVMRCGG